LINVKLKNKEENMKIRVTWAILLVVLMGFVGISAAEAGSFGPRWSSPRMGPRFDRLRPFYEFNLTDSQRAQIKDIITKFQDKTASLRSDIQKERMDFNNLLGSESFNEEEVRVEFRKASALREELFILRTKMQNEIKAVLTPEQLELLKEQKAKRMERLSRRSGREIEKGWK